MRCKCGCAEHQHKEIDGIFRCAAKDNKYHCAKFVPDDICDCSHFRTSHDVLGRCHQIIGKEGKFHKICKCNDYKENDRKLSNI